MSSEADHSLASEYWSVTLEARPSSMPRSALRWLLSIVSAAQAGSVEEVPVDVVIHDRATGHEVHRIRVDSAAEGDSVRGAVERDLKSHSLADFRSAWFL